MKLSIINGKIILDSADATVRLTVLPRRACEGDQTRIVLRADPMPAMTLQPEQDEAAEPLQAWVWDGTLAGAQALAPKLLSAVHKRFSSATTTSIRTLHWRKSVLESLFPSAPPPDMDAKRA